MEYKRFDTKLLVRLDPGDELVASLIDICKKEDIRLGVISGIGAVNNVTVGLFKTATKEYHSVTLEGDYEITCLTGNVSRMGGEVYLHLHATLSDIEHKAYGGHLNKAVVSATAEIWIDVVNGEIDREFSDTIGLNILKY
ncbi:PPC domain-containing DNA-binding protein [Desulfonatronum thioautotrophicum]|uniref:PPC domain-containing DNA-binding protein n=1 Tax=Desulfonatronum thioautotrophicum TaxID=617001 RepID=UPI0005EAFB73|nr:PPC domain-containing DNA-binding protein [Desulfonatronum thioautotrophicum]